jgi:hypothetical protein
MSDAAGAMSGTPRFKARGVTLPFIDRIWRVRGEIPVDPSLSPEDVFARIAPLLRTHGTALAVEGETLSFAKLNPAAQDKLATFNRGKFRIEPAGAGAVLRFDLFSNALLLCFLAPLLFLGFAQAAITLNAWEAAAEASEKSAKKDEEKPKPVSKLNPVDEFLGAPAPEDPNKKKDKDKDEEDEGRHSPDEAYVLAGLFAVIYLVGRWLEPWLLRRRVRAALASPPIPE